MSTPKTFKSIYVSKEELLSFLDIPEDASFNLTANLQKIISEEIQKRDIYTEISVEITEHNECVKFNLDSDPLKCQPYLFKEILLEASSWVKRNESWQSRFYAASVLEFEIEIRCRCNLFTGDFYMVPMMGLKGQILPNGNIADLIIAMRYK